MKMGLTLLGECFNVRLTWHEETVLQCYVDSKWSLKLTDTFHKNIFKKRIFFSLFYCRVVELSKNVGNWVQGRKL